MYYMISTKRTVFYIYSEIGFDFVLRKLHLINMRLKSKRKSRIMTDSDVVQNTVNIRFAKAWKYWVYKVNLIKWMNFREAWKNKVKCEAMKMTGTKFRTLNRNFVRN